jgi:tetratricopeptide (TPR) repeat protein
MEKLRQIEIKPDTGNSITVIRMPWVQLNDQNEAFAIYKQSRIFRNIPQIRYKGKIHESLSGLGEILFTDDISIMHTGYASGAFEETSKLERNIELLRAEHKEKPDDLTIKAYLADSLNNKARLENPNGTGADPEADILFGEVLKSSENVNPVLKKKAYMYFIVKYFSDADKYIECESLCERAKKEFDDDLDFEYFNAFVLNKMEKYDKARQILKELENTLSGIKNPGSTVFITADPMLVQKQLLIAAQGTGDIEAVITHANIVLSEDKLNQSILSPYIYTLINHGANEEEVVDQLGKIYDLGNPSDLLFITRAAKDCGAVEFARVMMIIAEEMLK